MSYKYAIVEWMVGNPNKCLSIINDALLNKRLDLDSFETLEDASKNLRGLGKSYISYQARLKFRRGIVEYDTQTKQATQVWIKDQNLKVDELEPKQREKDEVSLVANNTPNELTMTRPYLSYVSQIPAQLRYLLFVDYQFFHAKFETWYEYDRREPGCIEDLFNSAATFWAASPMPTPNLALSDVIAIHRSVSQALLSKRSLSGQYRDMNIGFPLDQNAVTFEGILAILKRIRHEGNQDGFVIGCLHDLKIVYGFFNCLWSEFSDTESEMLGKRHTIWKGETIHAEHVQRAKNTFFAEFKQKNQETYAQHRTAIDSLIETAINTTVHQFILTHKKAKDCHYSFMSDLLFDYQQKLARLATKEEYEFQLNLSRNASSNYSAKTLDGKSDQELHDIASTIQTDICKEESFICLFPPKIEIATQAAEQALREYNQAIQVAKSPDEVLTCIARLAHELEMLHLFCDANCRTVYFIVNQELIKHGLIPCMLYNPNRFDLFTPEQMVVQMKEGMRRFLYVVHHGEALATRCASIERYQVGLEATEPGDFECLDLLTQINEADYARASESLTQKITAFEQGEKQTLKRPSHLQTGSFFNAHTIDDVQTTESDLNIVKTITH